MFTDVLTSSVFVCALKADYGSTSMQRNNHADASTQSWTCVGSVSGFSKRTNHNRQGPPLKQGPCGGCMEGLQGHKGSVQHRTIISLILLSYSWRSIGCVWALQQTPLYSQCHTDLPGGRVEREVHDQTFPTLGDRQVATLRLKHHCGIYIFYRRQAMNTHRDGSNKELDLYSYYS